MQARISVVSDLPTVWEMPRGAIAQTNIRINTGGLRAKLFVFDTPTNLRRFWRDTLGHSLGRGCLGAVNRLSTFAMSVDDSGEFSSHRIEVDRRFFCVIGLCRKHLNMEIISHECVHVGYAFAARRARCWWDQLALDMDEECVAYPTGRAAAAINRFLHDCGLYE